LLPNGVAWFALKTRSRHEKLVARELAGGGVECFLPLVRRRHRWSDRVKTVELPLFTTYLFTRIDPVYDRLRVLKARGAVAFVGVYGEPLPVDEGEIDALRRLVTGGAPIEPHRFLRRGQRVRIRGGPFRGIEGTLIRCDGRTQVVISVDVLKQAAALEIDAADVEPA
jgi:transcription antitermination factor NusG